MTDMEKFLKTVHKAEKLNIELKDIAKAGGFSIVTLWNYRNGFDPTKKINDGRANIEKLISKKIKK